MFTLAHLSDPHLAPLPAASWSQLASKRLFGYLNWQRKRRRIHQRGTLDRIVADLLAQSPNHIALTGDLVNIALPDEFAAAREWVAALGPADKVSIVPGNHDAYVPTALGDATSSWRDYMCTDQSHEPVWPFVRRRAGVALIGLSTAIASPPLMATGRLGVEQLSRLVQLLPQLRDEGLFRIVLIHHPPESEPRRHRERLLDAAAFRDALAEVGAELVLHGHEHVRSVIWLDGPSGRIPAIGVPSASAAIRGHWQPAGYYLFRITGPPQAWHCEMVTRGFGPDSPDIVELDRRVLLRALNSRAA
jgi:3',5'-cyclic AMP phosphodiesterase CpdA